MTSSDKGSSRHECKGLLVEVYSTAKTFAKHAKKVINETLAKQMRKPDFGVPNLRDTSQQEHGLKF